MRFLPRFLVSLPLLMTVVTAYPAETAADVDDPEGVGSDMGYRLYGEAKKGKPLLLQNSRPFPVEVFEDQRGVYVRIPAYAERGFPCKGKSRLLHVRYIDQFSENAPFQVKISCGRELQFIAKRQLVTPAMGVKIPGNAKPPAASEEKAAEEAAAPAAGTAVAGEIPVTDTVPAPAPPAPPAAEEPPPFLSPVN